MGAGEAAAPVAADGGGGGSTEPDLVVRLPRGSVDPQEMVMGGSGAQVWRNALQKSIAFLGEESRAWHCFSLFKEVLGLSSCGA